MGVSTFYIYNFILFDLLHQMNSALKSDKIKHKVNITYK